MKKKTLLTGGSISVYRHSLFSLFFLSTVFLLGSCNKEPELTPANDVLSVTNVSPEIGSTGIVFDPVITVTFSAAIDPSVIYAGPVILQQSGQQIQGSLNCEGNSIHFTPHVELAPLTDYTILVTSSVQD